MARCVETAMRQKTHTLERGNCRACSVCTKVASSQPAPASSNTDAAYWRS